MTKNIIILFILSVVLGIISVHFIFGITYPNITDYIIGFAICLFYVGVGSFIGLIIKQLFKINNKNISINIYIFIKVLFSLFIFLSFSYYGFVVTSV